MALPGNKNFSDYDNYITDQNPTTSAQAQDYFRNQAELLKAVIDCDFWQPETVYQPGNVVKSDSMPNGTEAVMVATKASVTSNVEPEWGAVGGANISDGACFWKLRWQHWSKDIATQALAEAGIDNTKVMTPKGVDYRLNKDRQIRTFTSFEALGLSSSATLSELYSKLPNGGEFLFGASVESHPNLGIPITGVLYIYKNAGRMTCWATNEGNGNIFCKTYTSWGETDWVKLVTTDNVLPVGTIIPYLGRTVPTGYVDGNGGEVKRDTYQKLYSVFGNSFGAGDGSTTFNLPNLNDGSFLEGASVAGVIKEAGLPNIEGHFTIRNFADGYANIDTVSGAFALGEDGDLRESARTSASTYVTQGIKFNAENSSSIYGAASTVQPKSVTVRFCIKY